MSVRFLAPDVPNPPSTADWRVLRALTGYRWILAVGLLAGYFSGLVDTVLQIEAPIVYLAAAVDSAGTAMLASVTLEIRRPPLGWQTLYQVVSDILLVAVLVYASGGAAGGFGVLMLVPTVIASVLLNRRATASMAAFASLCLLLQEAYVGISLNAGQGLRSAMFTPAGLLGLLLFVVSLTANALAVRARRGEALARRVGVDLKSLARLNETIVQRMRAGVIVLAADETIQTSNPAAQRLLGLDHDAHGQALALAAPRLAVKLAAWRSNANAEIEPFESPQGREVIPQFVRLGWSAQQPLLIMLEDATSMVEQAQQMKLAALGRLSAGIAHEIRNPLAAITNAGQLLDESPALSADDRDLTRMIGEHGKRIDAIVRDVLSLSTPHASAPEPLALSPWLEEAVQHYHAAMPGHAITIDIRDVADGLQVAFDPLHLRRVLTNLWDNSRLNMPADAATRIELHARQDGDRVLLDVVDNGPGVPQRLADKLFEPFFTTRRTGTGLGLFMARELCRGNGAQLNLMQTDARPEQWPTGAWMQLALRAAQAKPDHPEADAEAAE